MVKKSRCRASAAAGTHPWVTPLLHEKPSLTVKTFWFPAQEPEMSNWSPLLPALSSPCQPPRHPFLSWYLRGHRPWMLLDQKSAQAPRPLGASPFPWGN